MRCLEPATPTFGVDAREVSQPRGEAEELTSPYLDGDVLDVHAWARDALALALPQQFCAAKIARGLCPVCGIDLNNADQGHGHEQGPDPRWAKLSELRLE